MRRKPNQLVPFEEKIIDIIRKAHEQGEEEVYGWEIAKTLDNGWHLTAYGTLYRALNRLVDMGKLEYRWEEISPDENRPRRRYYRLVSDG
jgi:DNA-binding PadR family transcriptional regulator